MGRGGFDRPPVLAGAPLAGVAAGFSPVGAVVELESRTAHFVL